MNYWALLILFSFISCNEKTFVEVPAKQNTQSQSDIVKVVFPHSKEFKKTRLHGVHYQNDKKLCQSCHMPLDTNTDELKNDFCMGCHKSYPHTKKFTASFEHGSAFLKDRTACLACHQVKDKLGTSTGKKACLACHKYPHGPSWVSKGHNKDYWENKIDEKMQINCQHCHQEESPFHQRHELQFVSCNSCHLQVPHDFKKFSKHYRASSRYTKKCTTCHNPFGKYHVPDAYPVDPPKKECSMCHDGISTNLKKFRHWQANEKKQKRAIASPVLSP